MISFGEETTKDKFNEVVEDLKSKGACKPQASHSDLISLLTNLRRLRRRDHQPGGVLGAHGQEADLSDSKPDSPTQSAVQSKGERYRRHRCVF